MVDETDIRDEKNWRYEHLALKTVANLKKRHLNAQYIPNRQAAFQKVMELIPEGATVGWGDSVTLYQIGVFDELHRTRPNLIFDPFLRDAAGNLITSGEERLVLMRKALTADVFLSGVNAITVDGKLVSVDATGNRVAGTIFGPKRVIIVAGANKIVANLDEALRRIKEIAAPLNAKRHVIKHHYERFAELPCVKTGTCVDCFHPDRICHYTVIIEGERPPGTVTGYTPRMYVLIVGEELGI